MLRKLTILAALLAALATLSGCHYYLSMMPRIIISSEPFTPPEPTDGRPPTAFQLGPD